MSGPLDPVALAADLIACPSVTPADAGAQDVLAAALAAQGFTVHRLVSGEAPHGPIANLVAIRGSGAPHFAFAGHTDVVPPGEGWTSGAFTPVVRDGLLYGRGAVDMKGAIAAFVAAADRVRDHAGHDQPADHRRRGGPRGPRHARDHRLDGRATASRPT